MGILIDNFFIGVEDWIQVTDSLVFSVDVVDLNYNISTSGTHFIHDGNIVYTTFSGISNGYRVFYDPPTPSGSIYLTIHAENDNSEIAEKDYSLLFGYNVEFNEYIDWGPNKEVLIWSKASNEAFCPNVEAYASYFQTRDLHSYNLGATIRPVGHVSLGGSLYPQNTFFFYGRTFTIKISGIKDFAGNIMEPYEFTFTIEDG